MDIRSLGFRTDLRLLEMTGSEIEDRGTHLVVRTPANPTYFWGNFLLLEQLPVPGGEREVIGAFHTEFPLAEHVSIGVDGTDDLTDAVQPFVEAGIEVDSGTVLTAGALVAAAARRRGRRRPARWRATTTGSAAPGSATTCGRRPTRTTFMTYARRKNDAGAAASSPAASAGGTARSSATSSSARPAIFVTHAGIARYQSVETHPDHRRQGLAAAVVHAAGEHALAAYGIEVLVIAADTDGDAIRIYRRLGFADVERHLTMERRPGAWA